MRLRQFLPTAVLAFSMQSNAALIGFVDNPTSNSVDWASQIALLGGSINSNVDFEALSTGTLDGSFYSLSDGVTLTPDGDVSTVLNGTGPAQGNTGSSPTSVGEGSNPSSNYLFDGPSPSSLTLSFDFPVLGVGLDTIDYFNPFDDNPLTIEAFTGINGGGISLGSFSSVGFNFQMNRKYFMGLVSTNNDIRSFVFTDVNSNTGDAIGLDNIVFATSADQANDVPAPATLALFGLGLAGLGFSRRKKA